MAAKEYWIIYTR